MNVNIQISPQRNNQCAIPHIHITLSPMLPKRKKRLHFPRFLCSTSSMFPTSPAPVPSPHLGQQPGPSACERRHCLLSRLSKGSVFVCLVKPMVTVYVITGTSRFFFFGCRGWHGAYFALGVFLKERVGSAMWSALGWTLLLLAHTVFTWIYLQCLKTFAPVPTVKVKR